MELYLGNEDSISQSEFQFLLEQEKNQKENEEKNEKDESNNATEKNEKIEINKTIEKKAIEDSSSESVDAPVNPVKMARANYIDIAAILLLIATISYIYWYSRCTSYA